MAERSRVAAVIVAGGRGTRFGGSVPKQFLSLGGRPVFFHSIERISKIGEVREIAVVFSDMALSPAVERQLVRLAKGRRITVHFRCAGTRRQDSVASGLGALSEDSDVILVHDAARPFPPIEGTKKVIDAARRSGGAILALRATDTVKQTRPGTMSVQATLARENIWLAQTPQAFRGKYLSAVINECDREDRMYTDESAILEELGVEVEVIEGEISNFKITTARDLEQARSLLARERRGGSNRSL